MVFWFHEQSKKVDRNIDFNFCPGVVLHLELLLTIKGKGSHSFNNTVIREDVAMAKKTGNVENPGLWSSPGSVSK